MNESDLSQMFPWLGVHGRTRAPLLRPALMLTLCLTAIGACAERPDPLEKALDAVESPEWQIEAVAPDGEFSLERGGRTVRARHVPTIHSEGLLVVHVPETKLLFVSDVYFPAAFPAGQPLPEPFSGMSQGLREQLPTFDWEVEWIAGGHGGIDSIADFHSHFDS